MTTSMRNRTVNRVAKAVLLGALIAMLSIVSGVSPNRVLPAQAAAGDGITAYVSPPFVQGPPSAYGAALEDFESFTDCNSFPASAVGTFTGTCNMITTGGAYVWGGASTTSDTPTAGGTPSRFVVGPVTQVLTLTFAAPVKYVGFWWSAGSPGNTVKLYTAASASTPAATFTTTTIDSILGSGIPSPYPGSATVSALDASTYKKGYYFGRPSDHTSTTPTSFTGSNRQSHAYLNIFASGSIAFTKIEFTGTGFEFDNVAVSTAAKTPQQNLVFIESVLGKTATFMANGGTGTMAAQTDSTSANLTANSYSNPGHSFTGWHTTISGTGGTSYANQASFNFASDITLYAQWTPNNLVVTHDTQGGSTIANGSTGTGAAISTSPGTPTRDGYTFNGWFAASTGGTAITFPYTHARTTDFTLYAQWTPNNLVVTHDTQGGSTIANGSTGTGAAISTSPGTPTRDGYTFNGWFAASTGGTAITFPYTHARTANFTLYAQWTLVPVPTTTTTTTATTTTTIATTTTLPIAAAAIPTASPTLQAPRTAVVGEPISVMAKGFKPGEKVVLRIGAGKTTTLIADAKGEVRLELVLGSTSRGKNQVVASAVSGGLSAKSEIRVTTPQVLPATGSTTAPLVMWGVITTLLGCAISWRRRIPQQ